MGKQWKLWQTLFLEAPKSLQMVIARFSSLPGRRGPAVSRGRACVRACGEADWAADACVVRGGFVCVVRHQPNADHLSKGC